MNDLGLFTPDLPGLLAIAVQVLLPLLVGLVGTRMTGAGRGVLLLALSVVTQFLTGWLDAMHADVRFQWQVLALNLVVGFAVSVASYFGLWKPVGATAKMQAVFAAKPGKAGR